MKLGRKFWKRIYEESAKKFGTTNIPVNTFNKVWIVPEKAVVYENAKAGTAYVVESRLKVMLEEDYLSLEKHEGVILSPERAKDSKEPVNKINQLGSQIVREVVIPELSKEINEGKSFAQLRQIYQSLILAVWYKQKIKQSILAKVYADKRKIAGVGYENSIAGGQAEEGLNLKATQGNNDAELIYQQYLKAFKKGVFNYIKEEQSTVSQELISRKYFSGGMWLNFAMTSEGASKLTKVTALPPSAAMKADFQELTIRLDGLNPPARAGKLILPGAPGFNLPANPDQRTLQRILAGGVLTPIAADGARPVQRKPGQYFYKLAEINRIRNMAKQKQQELEEGSSWYNTLDVLIRLLEPLKKYLQQDQGSQKEMAQFDEILQGLVRPISVKYDRQLWLHDLMNVLTKTRFNGAVEGAVFKFGAIAGALPQTNRPSKAWETLEGDMLAELMSNLSIGVTQDDQWVEATSAPLRSAVRGFSHIMRDAFVETGKEKDEPSAKVKAQFYQWVKAYLFYAQDKLGNGSNERLKKLLQGIKIDAVMNLLDFQAKGEIADGEIKEQWANIVMLLEYQLYPEHYEQMPEYNQDLLLTLLQRVHIMARQNKIPCDTTHLTQIIAEHLLGSRQTTVRQREIMINILAELGIKRLTSAQQEKVIGNIARYMDEGLPAAAKILNQYEEISKGEIKRRFESLAARLVQEQLSSLSEDEKRAIANQPMLEAGELRGYGAENYAVGFEFEMTVQGNLNRAINRCNQFFKEQGLRGWEAKVGGYDQMEITTPLYENASEGWQRQEEEINKVFNQGHLDKMIRTISSMHINSKVSPLDESLYGKRMFSNLIKHLEALLYRLSRNKQQFSEEDFSHVYLVPLGELWESVSHGREMINFRNNKIESRYQLPATFANGRRINLALLRQEVHLQYGLTEFARKNPDLNAHDFPIPRLLGEKPGRDYDRVALRIADKIFEGDGVGKMMFLKMYYHPVYGRWREYPENKESAQDVKRMYQDGGLDAIYQLHQRAGGWQENLEDHVLTVLQGQDLKKFNDPLYWDVLFILSYRDKVSQFILDNHAEWISQLRSIRDLNELRRYLGSALNDADLMKEIAPKRWIWRNLTSLFQTSNEQAAIELFKALANKHEMVLFLNMPIDEGSKIRLIKSLIEKEGFTSILLDQLGKIKDEYQRLHIMETLHKDAQKRYSMDEIHSLKHLMLVSSNEDIRLMAMEILVRLGEVEEDYLMQLASSAKDKLSEKAIELLMKGQAYRKEAFLLAIERHTKRHMRLEALKQYMAMEPDKFKLKKIADKLLPSDSGDGRDMVDIFVGLMIYLEMGQEKLVRTKISILERSLQQFFLMAIAQEMKQKGMDWQGWLEASAKQEDMVFSKDAYKSMFNKIKDESLTMQWGDLNLGGASQVEFLGDAFLLAGDSTHKIIKKDGPVIDVSSEYVPAQSHIFNKFLFLGYKHSFRLIDSNGKVKIERLGESGQVEEFNNHLLVPSLEGLIIINPEGEIIRTLEHWNESLQFKAWGDKMIVIGTDRVGFMESNLDLKRLPDVMVPLQVATFEEFLIFMEPRGFLVFNQKGEKLFERFHDERAYAAESVKDGVLVSTTKGLILLDEQGKIIWEASYLDLIKRNEFWVSKSEDDVITTKAIVNGRKINIPSWSLDGIMEADVERVYRWQGNIVISTEKGSVIYNEKSRGYEETSAQHIQKFKAWGDVLVALDETGMCIINKEGRIVKDYRLDRGVIKALEWEDQMLIYGPRTYIMVDKQGQIIAGRDYYGGLKDAYILNDVVVLTGAREVLIIDKAGAIKRSIDDIDRNVKVLAKLKEMLIIAANHKTWFVKADGTVKAINLKADNAYLWGKNIILTDNDGRTHCFDKEEKEKWELPLFNKSAGVHSEYQRVIGVGLKDNLIIADSDGFFLVNKQGAITRSITIPFPDDVHKWGEQRVFIGKFGFVVQGPQGQFSNVNEFLGAGIDVHDVYVLEHKDTLIIIGEEKTALIKKNGEVNILKFSLFGVIREGHDLKIGENIVLFGHDGILHLDKDGKATAYERDINDMHEIVEWGNNRIVLTPKGFLLVDAQGVPGSLITRLGERFDLTDTWGDYFIVYGYNGVAFIDKQGKVKLIQGLDLSPVKNVDVDEQDYMVIQGDHESIVIGKDLKVRFTVPRISTPIRVKDAGKDFIVLNGTVLEDKYPDMPISSKVVTASQSQASNPAQVPNLNKKGGIDLTESKVPLELKKEVSSSQGAGDRNDDASIFKIDPAMLAQYENAPGFVPVIINIQPMTDLRVFLGINNEAIHHT